MKYWGPINSTNGINGNDGYADGNATTGAQGSIPSFSGFEQTLRALSNLVVSAGRSPSSTINDFQLTDVVRSQRVNWAGTFGGTANGLTSTFSPAPNNAAELIGVPLTGIAALTNTGPATYSPNGFSGPIQWPDGTPLVGGEIKIGEIITLRWDGSRYQLFTGSRNRVNWSQKLPGFFHAHAAAFTTLVSLVWTKVAVTLENSDAEGWYNAPLSRFQPQKPGYYFISGDCAFGSDYALPTTGLRAFKNGTVSFAPTPDDVPGSQYSTQLNGSVALVAGLVYMNGTTDYLELFAYQDFPDYNGLRLAKGARFSGYFIGAA